MKKTEVFKKELTYIKNIDYRTSATKLLELVPDYFFEVPASSTGKYHPQYATGNGGLVRHTKAAMMIAKSLLVLETIGSKYTDNEKDLLLIALLFHDTQKCGNPKETYTRFDHPLLAAKFIKDNQNLTSFNDDETAFLEKAISSHMGQWNTSDYSDVTLPKPHTKYESFVHMCDYLASRKFLEVPFVNNDIVE